MWRVSAERRGATLIEVLIGATLFLFILGTIYASLAMGLDAYRRTENFATVQHQAMTGLREVTEELASAPRAAVRFETNAVVLPSARDASGTVRYDDSGRALWQAWVAFHLTDQGLMRSRQAFSETAELPALIPTSSQVQADGNATHKLVATHVESLGFLSGTSTAEVALVAANDLWGRTSVQVTDRVWFRK